MVRCLLYVLGFVLLLGSSSSVQAQAKHYHAQCGVGLAEGAAIKNRMFDNRRERDELLATFDRSRSSNGTVYVPVQFHIVNKSDGTGGEKVRDVLANLCELNIAYQPMNVEFYLAGPIRYINQDLLYTNSFDNGMANFFMGLYKESGVVNVFIGNEITNGQSGGTTLGYYTPGLDIIYCIQGAIGANATTLTHEMGHFFSLNHTFYGWENSQYGTVMQNTVGRTPTITLSGIPVENFYRTGGLENCQIAADGFCDTEPNYLFGFYGGTYNTGPNNCDYAATAIDPNGFLFRPDVIAPNPDRFQFGEDNPALTELRLRNRSTKDRLYPRTLVVVTTEYTLNGNTVTMWQDTIGDSDSTDFYVPTNTDDDIIENTGLDIIPGFISLGDHTMDVSISSSATLSFDAAAANYTITPSTNTHKVDMDSLRVTNTGTTPVAAGTVITITDILNNNGTQVSSDTRTISLPNALPAGDSYTFSAGDLAYTSTAGLAGVSISSQTYAPYRDTTGLTMADNVMSYYNDFCATQFSLEQEEAIKLDIAARGFATLYSEPTDITITETATVINPAMSAVAPQPLVNFQWNPVNGATMYWVHIYEISFLNIPVSGGAEYEFMATGTNAWQTLEPNKRYGWRVYPLNATSFCNNNATGSVQSNFQVYNWTVGVNDIPSEIESSKIYPNPTGASQDVLLEIKSSIEGDAQITIINSIGQEVMPVQTIGLTKGDNIQKLTTSSLSAGMYIITINTANSTTSHKLVIQNK